MRACVPACLPNKIVLNLTQAIPFSQLVAITLTWKEMCFTLFVPMGSRYPSRYVHYLAGCWGSEPELLQLKPGVLPVLGATGPLPLVSLTHSPK